MFPSGHVFDLVAAVPPGGGRQAGILHGYGRTANAFASIIIRDLCGNGSRTAWRCPDGDCNGVATTLAAGVSHLCGDGVRAIAQGCAEAAARPYTAVDVGDPTQDSGKVRVLRVGRASGTRNRGARVKG